MLRHRLRAGAWAIALAATSAFTLTDPPGAGERALLGWTPTRQAGSSNLRMARPEGRVSAGRALLGQLTVGKDQAGANEALQIQARRVDGRGALLGRP
jgi:hypothetical protein